MKSFTRFSVLALAVGLMTGSAYAVDLNSSALVDIVEGIVLAETAAMFSRPTGPTPTSTA